MKKILKVQDNILDRLLDNRKQHFAWQHGNVVSLMWCNAPETGMSLWGKETDSQRWDE